MRHGEPAPEHAQHGDFDNPSRVMLKSPPSRLLVVLAVNNTGVTMRV
jgi:hypothetical protein